MLVELIQLIPLFILIGVIVLVLLIFLVYSLISNSTNHRYQVFINHSQQEYILVYDILKNCFVLLNGIDTHNNEYGFEEFLTLLDTSNQDDFRNFINNLSKNTSKNLELSLKTTLFNKNKMVKTRFVYDKKEDNKIYIFITRAYSSIKQNDYDENFVPSKYKSNFIEDIQKNQKLDRSSLFICLNFQMYNFIQRRYGNSTLNHYLSMLDKLINKTSNHNPYCYYKDDVFIYFNSYKHNRRSISSICHGLIEKLSLRVNVDNHILDLRPQVGVSLYNDKSNDINKLIEFSYIASTRTDKKHYRMFDYKLFEKYQDSDNKIKNAKNIENELEKLTFFKPIYSLNSGYNIGYYNKVVIDNDYYKDFNDLKEFYVNKRLDKDFIKNYIVKSLNEYINQHKKSKILFLYLDVEYFDLLLEILDSDEQYKTLHVVPVVVDYDEIFIHSESYNKTIKALKDKGINLAIKVHESMQTSFSNILSNFKWLIIDSTFSSDISNNSDKRFDLEKILSIVKIFNFNLIATEVNDYNNAIILKQLGIDFLESKLLDPNLNLISTRKLAKLVKGEDD